ncbi:hypothetical protein [Amycolatopsis sp. NPDC003861]
MTTIERVGARAYRVPTPAPEADGTLAWDAITIVVVHAEAGGVHGLGWTYADAACVPLVEGVLSGAVRGRPGSRAARYPGAAPRRKRPAVAAATGIAAGPTTREAAAVRHAGEGPWRKRKTPGAAATGIAADR